MYNKKINNFVTETARFIENKTVIKIHLARQDVGTKTNPTVMVVDNKNIDKLRRNNGHLTEVQVGLNAGPI